VRFVSGETMQYRAALIGASLTVTPAPDGGTIVLCHLAKDANYGHAMLPAQEFTVTVGTE
jgi:hypothetical protein